jgi:hypothetical protein
MAPFSWLPYFFAVLYAVTSAATFVGNIAQPRGAAILRKSLADDMYDALRTENRPS